MNEKSLQRWADHITNYRLPVIRLICRRINIGGRILEIGSGSCWLSAYLSKQKAIKEIFAVEIDKDKLKIADDFFLDHFGGKTKKIKLICADFHKLPFGNNYFDFVVCDAALHHSKDLSLLLKELHRVLKKSGQLIAIREPVLPSMPGLKYFKKKVFGYKEKKRGDVENVYTLEEWREYFKKNGFKADVVKYTINTTPKEKIIRLAKSLNGLLFNRTYIAALKS